MAHGLAIALWAGSLMLYGAAFFFPEVHRRHDFFWSGVAAFYGLVLWFDAVQIAPTELLAHGASVALLGWFGWQTLSLRRKRAPLDLQTPLTAESWPKFWENLRRRGLGWAKASPLGQWLPKTWQPSQAIDPALAIGEIRVSSLKDVDYEFVDALASVDDSAAAVDLPTAPAPPPFSPTAPPKRVPAAPASTAKPPPPSFGSRVAGLRLWLGNQFAAKPAPPKREVIDIPPRPSPLARKTSQQDPVNSPPRPSPLNRKSPKREVIDIPPRPSPLDRYKNKPDPADAVTPNAVPPDAVIIVDAAASEVSRSEPTPAPGDEAIAHPAEAKATEDRAESAGSPESNWDDDDTNWVDD